MTTTTTVPYREYVKATDEVIALRAENERLRVALQAAAEFVAFGGDERCPSCGEVSAKTLMCRSCTLEQNERDQEDYAVCSGCGLRNHDTRDPFWNCPDYPNCRASVPW
jgi:ssDNA-binding Zn-finger/Zn-ribbon topoisomerase 1